MFGQFTALCMKELTHFSPMFYFYTPLKTLENQRFFVDFKGGIEMVHWAEMGEECLPSGLKVSNKDTRAMFINVPVPSLLTLSKYLSHRVIWKYVQICKAPDSFTCCNFHQSWYLAVFKLHKLLEDIFTSSSNIFETFEIIFFFFFSFPWRCHQVLFMTNLKLATYYHL